MVLRKSRRSSTIQWFRLASHNLGHIHINKPVFLERTILGLVRITLQKRGVVLHRIKGGKGENENSPGGEGVTTLQLSGGQILGDFQALLQRPFRKLQRSTLLWLRFGAPNACFDDHVLLCNGS